MARTCRAAPGDGRWRYPCAPPHASSFPRGGRCPPRPAPSSWRTRTPLLPTFPARLRDLCPHLSGTSEDGAPAIGPRKEGAPQVPQSAAEMISSANTTATSRFRQAAEKGNRTFLGRRCPHFVPAKLGCAITKNASSWHPLGRTTPPPTRWCASPTWMTRSLTCSLGPPHVSPST